MIRHERAYENTAPPMSCPAKLGAAAAAAEPALHIAAPSISGHATCHLPSTRVSVCVVTQRLVNIAAMKGAPSWVGAF